MDGRFKTLVKRLKMDEFVSSSAMAHLLGGGGGWRSRFRLLLAVEGGLDPIDDANRKNLWPLVDGLIAHANCFGSSRDGAAQLLNCFSFVHAEIES